MIRPFALAAMCMLSACASTYVADPNDPVDMSAAMGARGAQYVGLAQVCDQAAPGRDYHGAMAQVIAHEQARLGVLQGLVDRAYAGQPNETLSAHMQAQMAAHRLDAGQFCDAALAQARADLASRAGHILALGSGPASMSAARDRGWID